MITKNTFTALFYLLPLTITVWLAVFNSLKVISISWWLVFAPVLVQGVYLGIKYLRKLKLILILLLICSCSKEEITETVRFTGIFATLEIQENGADYVEIEYNGKTIVHPVRYVPHGLRSDFFEMELQRDVTSVKIFNKEGELTHYVKDISELGSQNGLVVTGVPFVSKKGDIVVQLFD